MKKILLAAATLSLISGATVAQAATLTFDNLTTVYGDGQPLGPNMTGNGQTLVYTEQGYTLSLVTTNAVGTTFGAHIGDGAGIQNFNWHDDGDNLSAYVELALINGGAFNFNSFNYQVSSGNGLTVTAAGFTPLFFANTSGTSFPNFNNVTSVRFSSAGFTFNGLDNIVVNAVAAVPEPASWLMMLVGFGLIGATTRYRRRATKVAYA